MLARVIAIARVRLEMAFHSLQGSRGAWQVVSSAVIIMIGGLFALGMAAGLGAMAYFAVNSDDPEFLKITYVVVFFACAFLGIFMPLLFAASGHGLDLRRLLIFPVTRGQLFGLSLGSAFLGSEHAFYYPTLLAVSLAAIVLPGRHVIAGLAIVLAFTAFVVTWSHAIMMLLQGLMQKRRSREIVVFVIFMAVVLASLVPAMLAPSESTNPANDVDQLLETTRRWSGIAELLPPFIAATGLQALHGGERVRGLISLVLLLMWLVPGATIGHFIFTRQILGDGGSRGGTAASPVEDSSSRRGVRGRFDATDLPVFSSQVIAMTVRELRYLSRSVVGKFNLVMSPIFAVIIVFAVTRELPSEAFLGVDPETLALFGMLGYMTLFSNNFVNNAFAWEGPGVQLYFCGPLRLDEVLLGKNLGVWLFTGVTAILAVSTWSILKGVPGLAMLLSGLLAFACCMVAFTTVGNFTSVLFPVSRDCSSMTNSPSGSAVIIGLATLFLTAGVTSVALLLPVALGFDALQPLVVGILLGMLVLIYRWSLGRAATLMASRAESLIDALKG